jgi:hypothetical protein
VCFGIFARIYVSMYCTGSDHDASEPHCKKNKAVWSEEQSREVLHHFAGNIKKLKVPGKELCEQYLSDVTRYEHNLVWVDVENKIIEAVQKEKRSQKKSCCLILSCNPFLATFLLVCDEGHCVI